MILKSQLLCSGAESDLRVRVLAEVEKGSFIVLPGKGGHSRLVTLKNSLLTWEVLSRSFMAINSSRAGLLIILGYAQRLYSFNLVSGCLQINLSCSQDYQTVTFSLE